MPAAQPATPAAAHTPPGQPQQQAASGNWKSQVLRTVALWMAFQGVVGPNGLIAWYRGRTASQLQQQQDPSISVSGDATSASSVPASQPAKPLGAAPASLIPGTATALQTWHPAIPLDVYGFLYTAPPPTLDDIGTQFSILVPGGKGAWTGLAGEKEPHEWSGKEFEALLEDPIAEMDIGAERESVIVDSVIPFTKGTRGETLKAFKWTDVVAADKELKRTLDVDVSLPDSVRTGNHSVWIELFVTPKQSGINWQGRGRGKVLRIRKLLTRLLPERKQREERNLLSRSSDDKEKEEEESKDEGGGGLVSTLTGKGKTGPIVTHWYQNLSLALIQTEANSQLPIGKLPPPLLQHLHVSERAEKDETSDMPNVLWLPEETGTSYRAAGLPLLFVNDFWILREHMHQISAVNETVPLHIELYSTSFFKFQVLAALADSFEKSGSIGAGELDMVKRALLETAPWYLVLTVAVSILHSIFEMLAFGSEIKHWKDKKDFQGVSLGTILTNIVCQVIILLYLVDSSEETSWMILGSQAMGVAVEAWKITKAVSVGLIPRPESERKGIRALLPYKLDVQDKHVLSDKEKETQEYDKQAFKLVGIFSIPLLVGSTVYSALYDTHRGWYSFFVKGAVQFVYMFGFAALVPQLLVNYKLKSTAGMNFKTMIYKTLGTFVDDLFAFAVPMPWLHRLACFRDDVVFFVFLYQRWIYPTDPTRRNEFGQIEAKEEVLKERELAAGKGKEKGEESNAAAGPEGKRVVEGKKNQ